MDFGLFGSKILDVAVGLIFVYLVLSFAMTALQEALEAFLKKRARTLETAIIELLDGKPNSEIVTAFYNHPLISALYKGTYDPKKKPSLPSYIPSRTFALVMEDIFGEDKSGVKFSVAPDLKNRFFNAYTVLKQSFGADAEKMRSEIEGWFDAAMDRASGWYKREASKFLLLAGFIVSAVLNANTILIADKLYRDNGVRSAVATMTEAKIDLMRAMPELTGASATPASDKAAADKTVACQAASDKPADDKAKAACDTADKALADAVRDETQASQILETKIAAATTARDSAKKATDEPCKTSDSKPCVDAKAKLEAAQKTLDQLAFQKQQMEARKTLVSDLYHTGLPLGWDAEEVSAIDALGWSAYVILPLGWFLTALAISLGAPFWFDLLNKFMVVRSTVKPNEKSRPEGSKDEQPSSSATIDKFVSGIVDKLNAAAKPPV